MDINTGIVVGRRTTTNREGTRAVRLLLVQVTDEQDVQTAQLMSHTGEESNPPLGSMVSLIGAGESFKIAVASTDGIEPDLAIGGKRLYATDQPGATVMAEVRLDPDGKVTVTNPGATITISPDGLVTIEADGETHITSAKTIINNNVQVNGSIDATDTITAPNVNGTTQVTGAGKLLSTHTHGGVQTGSGTTGGPS